MEERLLVPVQALVFRLSCIGDCRGQRSVPKGLKTGSTLALSSDARFGRLEFDRSLDDTEVSLWIRGTGFPVLTNCVNARE
jgi:hypothetical protein